MDRLAQLLTAVLLAAAVSVVSFVRRFPTGLRDQAKQDIRQFLSQVSDNTTNLLAGFVDEFVPTRSEVAPSIDVKAIDTMHGISRFVSQRE